MKRIISICILLSFYSISFAQWTIQNSGTTENLNAIQMINSNTGYIVGNDGTILKTTNSGSDWTLLSSGTSVSLNSLFFVEKDTGFVSGSYFDTNTNSKKGILLKTFDGGLNWLNMNFQFEENILDIFFLNFSTGFASCGPNGLLKTIDGGVNWTEVSIEYTKATIFPSELIGFAIMGGGIGKSIDGGINWSIIKDDSSPDYNGANILGSIFFTSDTKGFFGSQYYGGIYSTTNGGSSLDYNHPATFSIHFPTESIGYAITNFDGVDISQTTDSGLSWEKIYTSNLSLSDIFFSSSSNGWAVGEKGTILHNTNVVLSTNNIIKVNNKVSIYPNPSNSLININVEDGISITKLTIYNNLGIIASKYSLSERILEIGELPSGVYVLKIETDKGTVSKKIIKK